MKVIGTYAKYFSYDRIQKKGYKPDRVKILLGKTDIEFIK